METPTETPTEKPSGQAPGSDARPTSLEQLAKSLPNFPSVAPMAPLFSSEPEDRFVIKTLDAEMVRLEQAVTRSGWTTWAGTAALGALAWIFITLLDSTTSFSWPRFAQLVTILSFVQEFIYSLEYNLRPRRGYGLLAGSQLRVMRTNEAFLIARPQSLFYLVRASLLAIASYTVLPELIGGWWWAPFIIYTIIALAMCTMLAMSASELPFPKSAESSASELLGASAALGIAGFCISAMLDTWQDGDLQSFKAALIAVAAIHVIRGLTAPQYELPALEKLQDIRRKLGFGQISAIEAVGKADAALLGYMALIFLAAPITNLENLIKKTKEDQATLADDIGLIERQVRAIALQQEVSTDDVRMRESLIGRSIQRCSDILKTCPSIIEARRQLANELSVYKKGTKNDQSIPMVERMAQTFDAQSTLIFLGLPTHLARLLVCVGALEESVNKHRLRLASNLRISINNLHQETLVRLEELRTSKALASGAAPGQTGDRLSAP